MAAQCISEIEDFCRQYVDLRVTFLGENTLEVKNKAYRITPRRLTGNMHSSEITSKVNFQNKIDRANSQSDLQRVDLLYAY